MHHIPTDFNLFTARVYVCTYILVSRGINQHCCCCLRSRMLLFLSLSLSLSLFLLFLQCRVCSVCLSVSPSFFPSFFVSFFFICIGGTCCFFSLCTEWDDCTASLPSHTRTYTTNHGPPQDQHLAHLRRTHTAGGSPLLHTCTFPPLHFSPVAASPHDCSAPLRSDASARSRRRWSSRSCAAATWRSSRSAPRESSTSTRPGVSTRFSRASASTHRRRSARSPTLT